MIVFPNAKINIGLRITGKRTDGFHNLETIFYPVSLSDMLEFSETESKTKFTNTGLQINIPDSENLVLKAYYLLKEKYNLPELHIHLHKIIPFGAGLGGGSSDAAFMLKALNRFFALHISEQTLENYAQELGSDCPFFIRNKPVFAKGTGNIFSKLQLDLSEYYILIVRPNIHVGTKEAFSNICPKPATVSLKEQISTPLHQWKEVIKNDFEDNIFKLYPQIKSIKTSMYKAGALYVQMSGSGSAVFGIFEKEPHIAAAYKQHFYYLQKPQ